MLNVFFHSADRKLSLPNKIKIRQFIQDIFKEEKIELKRVDYIFCSDEYLLDINKRFLNHNFFTDTITFDLSDTKTMVEGEIYISADRIKENAFNLKIKPKEEFLRVIIHGALHLCGYNDETKNEILLIRERENYYLNKLNGFT